MEGTRHMSSADYRNAIRRELRGSFEVTDSMTGLRVGHLIDLSSTGLQVATAMPLSQDALYQWRLPLPPIGNRPATEVECGVHVLWVSAETPGEYTAGGRFIQIARDVRERIATWSEGG